MEHVNEIQISYKSDINLSNSIKITSSEIAGKVIYENWNHDNLELFETFKVILLNNQNQVKGITTISTGGITGTLVDIRILFATVLKTLSTAIILTHNHPSGILKPSRADIDLTNKIIKAAELLDVKVLDHIIIAPNGMYYSFSDDHLI